MTPYYVEDFLARALQVKRHQVGRWELRALSSSITPIGRLGQVSVPGRMEATLSVQLGGVTHEINDRLCNLQGALRANEIQAMRADGYITATVTLDCLYGKETQHLFKALLQAFTVRGSQRKRKTK